MRPNTKTPLILLCGALAAFTPMHAASVTLASVGNIRQPDYEFDRPALFPAPNSGNAANSRAPRIAGRSYETGVIVQLNTTLFFAINGGTKFTAVAGVDDSTTANDARLTMAAYVDGQKVWESGELRKGQAPVPVELDLRGKKELRLVAEDVGHAQTRAHASWADARCEYEDKAPASMPFVPYQEEPYILTPKPKPEPRLTSARVFGARPGNPFLFNVSATGERPMTFAAEGLPPGLQLDEATGRITGRVVRPGTHVVTVRARNARGTAEQKLRLEIGEKIALTPPMGWNSWNCFGPEVTADKVRRAAHAMVKTGLIHHGWTYINIDDAWQAPQRGGSHHAIQGNEKFPDLKGLVDEIHGLGLKAGIYSTPWETSYAGYIGGSADTEQGEWRSARDGGPRRRHQGNHTFAYNDAKQFAEWGFDYLKYDWNPKSTQPAETEGQFHFYVATMAHALRTSGRDILYSYSNSMPFEWAADQAKFLHAWRTTGDIHDAWGYILRIGFTQDRWRPYAGPGHWNDPDMLVVGYVSVGSGRDLHPTKLTPNEQYSHITLWSLLASPLLIGCDMDRVDEFTLSLLSNDEVLEVNQDPRGEQAAQIVKDGRREVWAKQLEDGSHAVGLFNLGSNADTVSIAWEKLGLKGKPARVRDLWRQQDSAEIPADAFSAKIPRHGAAMIRVWPAK